MIIEKLKKANLIHPPKWMDSASVAYLTITGSQAYAVNTDSSDLDLIGFCMPPREIVFPHSVGIIPEFGKQAVKFNVWQQHHVKSEDGKTEYDFTVHNIVTYFDLCMKMNPNMVDTLFTAENCVTLRTPISDLVRENRKLFLSLAGWDKFKGYSFAQMKKIEGGANQSNPKRAEQTAKFGYDVKFGYHVVRLMLEIEQIMLEGDLDLQKHREQLKAIRRGEWTLDYLKQWRADKEAELEKVYTRSTLRQVPAEDEIRTLLLTCLEEHYGSLSTIIQKDIRMDALLAEMRQVMSKYG